LKTNSSEPPAIEFSNTSIPSAFSPANRLFLNAKKPRSENRGLKLFRFSRGD
jgi:hypothetical protein